MPGIDGFFWTCSRIIPHLPKDVQDFAHFVIGGLVLQMFPKEEKNGKK